MVFVKDTEDVPMCLVLMECAKGLDKAGLLSLNYMPHFGHSTKVIACVKKILVSFNSVFLWLNHKVSMDFKLIAMITRLPLLGLDPTPFFIKKEQDTTLKNKLKEKYDLTRDTRGFFIASINDHTVWFATKVLASKLVEKMLPNQCTA